VDRYWQGNTAVLRNKTAHLPLCPPQNPTGTVLDWVGVLVRYMTMWLWEYPSVPTSIWIPVIQPGANHLTVSSWFNNSRACVNIYVPVVPRARVTAYVWLTFSVCELGFIIYRYRWKSNQNCQQPVTEALHIEYRKDMVKRFMARVHKFSKKIFWDPRQNSRL